MSVSVLAVISALTISVVAESITPTIKRIQTVVVNSTLGILNDLQTVVSY